MDYISKIRQYVGHMPIMATAVLGIIYDKKRGILFEKRSDNGMWCVPGGAIELGETLEQALKREVKEETGITLDPDRLNFLNFNADPKSDKRQNVTFRYIAWVNYDEALAELTTKYSEKDEVMEVRFIPLSDIKEYSWAFNHQNLIEELVLW